MRLLCLAWLFFNVACNAQASTRKPYLGLVLNECLYIPASLANTVGRILTELTHFSLLHFAYGTNFDLYRSIFLSTLLHFLHYFAKHETLMTHTASFKFKTGTLSNAFFFRGSADTFYFGYWDNWMRFRSKLI